MIPTEKSKVDLQKMAADIEENLRAPMPGISRSKVFDAAEADQWGQLQNLPGM